MDSNFFLNPPKSYLLYVFTYNTYPWETPCTYKQSVLLTKYVHNLLLPELSCCPKLINQSSFMLFFINFSISGMDMYLVYYIYVPKYLKKIANMLAISVFLRKNNIAINGLTRFFLLLKMSFFLVASND